MDGRDDTVGLCAIAPVHKQLTKTSAMDYTEPVPTDHCVEIGSDLKPQPPHSFSLGDPHIHNSDYRADSELNYQRLILYSWSCNLYATHLAACTLHAYFQMNPESEKEHILIACSFKKFSNLICSRVELEYISDKGTDEVINIRQVFSLG